MLKKLLLLQILVGFIVSLCGVSIATAQERGREPPQEMVAEEVEAVSCWWRADKSAARVGEPFQLILTCRTVETEADTVVVNESGLAPQAISLPPFNVIGGERYDDIRKDHFRFFQYLYEIKFLEEGLFGGEAEIPPLEVSYHLETRSSRGEKIAGQDKLYQLPAFKINIFSLVTEEAKDIRDSSETLFGNVQVFKFRANISFAFGIFFLLAAVIAASRFGFTSIRDRNKKKVDRGVSVFSDSALLGRMVGELRRIKRAVAREGWNTELVSRALSVLRVVGAMLISGKIKQTTVDASDKGLQGQVKLRKWPFSSKKVLVSSGVTVETVRGHLVKNNLLNKRNGEFLEIFEKFSRFRHEGVPVSKLNQDALSACPNGDLNEPLSRFIRFTRTLRLLSLWPVKKCLTVSGRIRRAFRAWKE